MAYIKVNVNSILSYADILVATKNSTVGIRNRFVTIANDIDWNVKNCDAIYESISRIVNEMDAEDSTFNNHVTFLNQARILYGYLDGYSEVNATTSVSETKIASSNTEASEAAQISKKENPWYEGTIADSFKLYDILSGLPNQKQPFTDFEISKYSVDLGFVVPAVLGFKSLVYEVYNNAIDRYVALDQIENDDTLTDDEKEYMKNVINQLSDFDAGVDAVSWALGCVPLAGKLASFIFDHLDDACNSDSVKSELLEGYREINDAKAELEQADSFLEKTGAAMKVGWECVESAAEVTLAAAKEFVCDVVETGCEMVENLIVEPVKQIVNGVKKLFKGW